MSPLIIAIIVNAAWATVVALEIYSIRKCISGGRKVRAKIIDFLCDDAATPILEIQSPEGVKLRIRARIASGSFFKKTGNVVDAIYADGCNFALIDTFPGRWGSATILGIFQLIALGFLVLTIIYSK
jgi:hypothetical protein